MISPIDTRRTRYSPIKRVTAKDSALNERDTAAAVWTAIKIKTKIGMKSKKKMTSKKTTKKRTNGETKWCVTVSNNIGRTRILDWRNDQHGESSKRRASAQRAATIARRNMTDCISRRTNTDCISVPKRGGIARHSNEEKKRQKNDKNALVTCNWTCSLMYAPTVF